MMSSGLELRLWRWGTVFATIGIGLYLLVNWRFGAISDTALIGVMARAILEDGDRPIFVWGVGYQGILLEAYAVALAYKVFGYAPWVLNLWNTCLYCVLIFVFYQVVRESTHSRVAIFSSAILLGMSPEWLSRVVRTQPNYTETYLMGLLLFLLVQRVQSRGVLRRKEALAIGFLVGFGFYTYKQFAYFVAALLPSLIMKIPGLEWRRLRSYLSSGLFSNWIPRLFLGMSAFYFLLHVVLFLRNSDVLTMGSVRWAHNSVDGMKEAIKYGGVWIVLDLLWRFRRDVQKWAPSLGFIVAGVCVGYLPALVVQWQGGVVADQTGVSGTLSQVGGRLGIALHWFGMFFPLWIPAVLGWIWIIRKNGIRWLCERPILILPLVVLLGFAVSHQVVDLTHGRYVQPICLFFAVAAGMCLDVFGKWRSVAALGVVIWGWYQVHLAVMNARIYPGESLVPVLKEKGIQYGFSHYHYSHSITLYSNYNPVIVPMDGPQSPYLRKKVEEAERIAVIDYEGGNMGSLLDQRQYLPVSSARDSGIQLTEFVKRK